MQPLQEIDFKNILVANSKSITHKSNIRKKKLGFLSKCSRQATIQVDKENRFSRKQEHQHFNKLRKNVNLAHKRLSSCLQLNDPKKTQPFEPKSNLEQTAIQSLHLLSIDTDNQYQHQSKILTRWYNESSNYVMKKQRSISSTPYKSNKILKKKILSQKQKVSSSPFAYWELSSEQKLYNLNQDVKLMKNFKDSLLLNELKLRKRKYRSNLFDFVSLKAAVNRTCYE